MRTHFTREEQTYFRKRVDDIRVTKIHEIQQEYEKGYLDVDEKLQLIASGIVDFKMPTLQMLSETPWVQVLHCYDFSEFIAPKCSDDLRQKRLEDVEIEATQLRDYIMANDEGQRAIILRRLNEFERRAF